MFTPTYKITNLFNFFSSDSNETSKRRVLFYVHQTDKHLLWKFRSLKGSTWSGTHDIVLDSLWPALFSNIKEILFLYIVVRVWPKSFFSFCKLSKQNKSNVVLISNQIKKNEISTSLVLKIQNTHITEHITCFTN